MRKVAKMNVGAWIAFAAAAHLASPAAANTPSTTQVKLDGQTFTLPDSFSIERVAGSPLVERPIVADLDERGRLYVADSSGSNEKVDVQLQKKPHRIVRLEDTDGDGRYDRSQVFADKMMFPEGVMWLAGSLYVAAPPQIWKLTDTNDDGVADRREVWFDGKTLTGCANDLHGPYRGPDGWIYWCKGAFAEQTYTQPSGKKFTTRASHIFRARPDGTGIEPVMTGGMDNPVDVAFTPGGERIFTTTFMQHPAGGRRDGLIHAIYGGIYGKDHDPIHAPDHKWTSPQLMPVLSHMGPAAPCGLHRLESGQFGADASGKPYRDNLFACQFNLRKVSRHQLKAAGSTFTSEDSDFLVSDHHDFHPTDVIEDADGSLLVVNTGGWYKLCCPSSQLVKADVLGAIYRIRRVGAHKNDDPRGLKLDWSKPTLEELDTRLRDRHRPAVQRRAMEQLALRGRDAVPTLIKGTTGIRDVAEVVVPSVWTLCRIDDPAAREATRHALYNRYLSTRQAAIHAVGVWRDAGAIDELRAILLDKNQGPTYGHDGINDAQIARAAAEALGRIGDARAVDDLYDALARDDFDRGLEHSLTFAILEIASASAVNADQVVKQSLRRLKSETLPRIRRAALVVLDAAGKLDAVSAVSHLDHPDADLRETAQWIAGRHPEWGAALVSHLRERLRAVRDDMPAADREALVGLLARLASDEAVATVLGETVREAAKSPHAARVALAAMSVAPSAAKLREPPAAWLGALAVAATPDSPLLPDVLSTIRTLPPAKSASSISSRQSLESALRGVAESRSPASQRLAALAALPGNSLALTATHFALLLEHLDRDHDAKSRGAAADVLSRARLSSEQLLQLAARMPRAGPLEIDRLLAAFAQSGEEAVGRRLLTALQEGDVRSFLRVDALKPRLAKYGPAVQAEADKLYTAINGELAQQQSRLNEIATSLLAGDIRRGQAVFNSAKNSCLACHTIGYVGGKIGPDLTRIGGIRTERDLLESILFPSASFVRSYESLAVRTADGRTFSGILKKDAADEIILIETADKEVRIPRSEIETVQPGKVSVMPAGLDKQLTPQELADLVAFLKACK